MSPVGEGLKALPGSMVMNGDMLAGTTILSDSQHMKDVRQRY